MKSNQAELPYFVPLRLAVVNIPYNWVKSRALLYPRRQSLFDEQRICQTRRLIEIKIRADLVQPPSQICTLSAAVQVRQFI